MYTYPPGPDAVQDSLLKPSPAFKKEALKVLFSILLFLIVYLVLLALSAILVFYCFRFGVMILTAGISILTILGGLGMIGLGLMVFIFLVKFIFSYTKTDRSAFVEITETDQPELFSFIRQLTIDTRTPFPKKIYLSSQVNASVFYDSGFWSMFFPVRKNLEIGLGLVNAVNVSEFKAIMAHEFGHFSQRSMKLGSYVYQVNRILYNMLFDNSTYSGFLQGWASVHGVFAIFAMLTAKIAELIQWVLRKMYGLMNLAYMSLSRQMEFHADTVAASVSGGEALVSGLRRIEFAMGAQQVIIDKCNELLPAKKKIPNLFAATTVVSRMIAGDNKLILENGLPVFTDQSVETNLQSAINFKDQWASHPSVTDRVEHLRSLKLQAEMDTSPAWTLFANRDVLEKELSDKIYMHTEGAAEMESLDAGAFEQQLNEERAALLLPEHYNGYYDDRPFPSFSWDLLKAQPVVTETHPEALFDKTETAEFSQKKMMEYDLVLLTAISEGKTVIKTFDYNGKKYKQSDAVILARELKEALDKLNEKQAGADLRNAAWFVQQAENKGQGAELKRIYDEYTVVNCYMEELRKSIALIGEIVRPLYEGVIRTETEATNLVRELKGEGEPGFKKALRAALEEHAFDEDNELKQQVSNYLGSAYWYFHENLIEEDFISLGKLMNASQLFLERRYQRIFRNLLVTQWRMATETF